MASFPSVDLVAGQTQSPEPNSAESLPEAHRREAAACAVCGSKITEAFKRRSRAHSLHLHNFELRDLVRGASAGCRDCDLVVKAVTCWPSVMTSDMRLRVRVYSKSNRREIPETHLRIRVPVLKDPGVSEASKISNSLSQSFDGFTEPDTDLLNALLVSAVSESKNYMFLEIFRIGGTIFHPHSDPSTDNTPPKDVEPQWSTIAQERLTSRDTSSEIAFDMVTSWIAECLANHSRCSKNTISSLPKRIIEIFDDRVYLREMGGAQQKYASLSHCWGKKGAALQLTNATIGTLKDGFPRNMLPRTFRDATEICSRLGICFIWIDAICIIQDDLSDWKEAAATMADIYERAFINIGATWSDNSDKGCFSLERDDLGACGIGDTGLWVRRAPASLPKIKDDDTDRAEWPLLGRGWVFQERQLCARMIHYARNQLFWECKSASLSECGKDELSIDDRSSTSSTAGLPFKFVYSEPNQSWHRLVEPYTALMFTRSSDILPALAGIVAQEMLRRPDDIYVAGMWKSSLLEDLAFKNYGNARKITSGPSWSWSSYEGHCIWLEYNRLPTLSVVALNFTPVGPANIGEVINASIKLKGPVIMATVVQDQEHDSALQLVSGPVIGDGTTMCISAPVPQCSITPDPGTSVTLMLFSPYSGYEKITALALEEKTVRGRFTRLGIVDLRVRTPTMVRDDDDDYLHREDQERRAFRSLVNDWINSIPLRELEIF